MHLAVLIFGFVIAWWLVCQIAAMAINAWRARSGAHINDRLSAFMIGFGTGPLAIMAAFYPHTINPFKGSLALGGLVGSLTAWRVFDRFLM